MQQRHPRRFDLQGSEVCRLEETYVKRKEIRHEFKKLEAAGLVTVRRDVNNHPSYIELVFANSDQGLRKRRSFTICQLPGKTFLKAQAWAVSESRREVRRRFRE